MSFSEFVLNPQFFYLVLYGVFMGLFYPFSHVFVSKIGAEKLKIMTAAFNKIDELPISISLENSILPKEKQRAKEKVKLLEENNFNIISGFAIQFLVFFIVMSSLVIFATMPRETSINIGIGFDFLLLGIAAFLTTIRNIFLRKAVPQRFQLIKISEMNNFLYSISFSFVILFAQYSIFAHVKHSFLLYEIISVISSLIMVKILRIMKTQEIPQFVVMRNGEIFYSEQEIL